MISSAALLCLLAATPIPDGELARFGELLASELSAGREPISTRFDFDAFLERTIPGVAVPLKERTRLREGFTSRFGKAWATLAKECKYGSRATYRRIVDLDGLSAVQLRFLWSKGGYDFMEFSVARSPRGGLRIVDIFDLRDGSTWSAEERLRLLPLIERGARDRLFSTAGTLLEHLTTVSQMKEAASGRPEEAVTLWKALPAPVRDERLPLSIYLDALWALDDKAPAYRSAILHFIERYPDDASQQLRAVEADLFDKDLSRYLKGIDVIEKRIGRDALFDLLRAHLKLADGHDAEGRKLLENAITMEPTLKEPWLTLIELAADEKKWGEVLRLLTDAQKKAGLTLELEADIDAAFVASKEGQTWLKSHPK